MMITQSYLTDLTYKINGACIEVHKHLGSGLLESVYCEALKEQGLLCKETHDTVIRFAPPLVITKEELDMALEKIKSVFA